MHGRLQGHILNNLADKLAAGFNANSTPPLLEELLPSRIASLQIENQLIHSRYHSNFLYHSSAKELASYLVRKFKWSTKTTKLIVWKHLGQNIESLPIKQ